MLIHDEIAQKLEKAGLWRRAAHRWLNVIFIYELSSKQREWAARRRKFCLSCAASSSPADTRLDVHEMNRAATALLIQMGLSKPRKNTRSPKTGSRK